MALGIEIWVWILTVSLAILWPWHASWHYRASNSLFINKYLSHKGFLWVKISWDNRYESEYTMYLLHIYSRCLINVIGLVIPNWTQLRCPSIDAWLRLNKSCYIHPMENYSETERKKLLIHTKQINLQSIMLTQKIVKVTLYMIPLI